jgi:hypothetical protein
MSKNLGRMLGETLAGYLGLYESDIAVELMIMGNPSLLLCAEEGLDVEVSISTEYLYLKDTLEALESVFSVGIRFRTKVGVRLEHQGTRGCNSTWCFKVTWDMI